MLIVPATTGDLTAIDALLDEGFGADRRGRTAYRLRECASPVAGLSFVARDGDRLAGSAQTWDIALRAADGASFGLWLLGPVAVAKGWRGQGVATALIRAILSGVDARDPQPRGVLLIGDESFYGRFGFSAVRTGGWSLPGPVDPARLLLRGGAGLPATGQLGPGLPVRRAA